MQLRFDLDKETDPSVGTLSWDDYYDLCVSYKDYPQDIYTKDIAEQITEDHQEIIKRFCDAADDIFHESFDFKRRVTLESFHEQAGNFFKQTSLDCLGKGSIIETTSIIDPEDPDNPIISMNFKTIRAEQPENLNPQIAMISMEYLFYLVQPPKWWQKFTKPTTAVCINIGHDVILAP